MVGKIKHKHHDKPSHQRWLYQLSDYGIVKALLIIWGIFILILIGTILLIKAVVTHFK